MNVCSMKIQFVGVGEAFDETLPNNSQLLEWENTRLLIDCGYAVPHSLWKLIRNPILSMPSTLAIDTPIIISVCRLTY